MKTEKLKFDKNIFKKMMKSAEDVLSGNQEMQNAQVLVLLTSKRKEYASFIKDAVFGDKTDEKNLMDKLIKAEDTQIDYILCRWQSGEIDITSYSFRKMLLNMNPYNAETAIFVMTGNGYSNVELERTL